MRKYLLLIGVLISMTIQVSASKGGAETTIKDSVESEVTSTSLAGVLANVVDNHDNGAEGDSYIVYDASSDEYLTLSADEYALACAFASVIVHEDVASAGGEWIKCGSMWSLQRMIVSLSGIATCNIYSGEIILHQRIKRIPMTIELL